MNAGIYSEMQNEIVGDLTIELKESHCFYPEILAIKVKNAIQEVIVKRNYANTTYTDEQIKNDLRQYYSVITNVARYDYNQIGIEGEQQHGENGVTRVYVKREDFFKDVYPFVKIF